jgi:hypothetical protein
MSVQKQGLGYFGDEDPHAIIRDALDPNVPVPMMMRDSMTPPLHSEYARKKLLVTDGTSDPFGLHRPGYRFPVHPPANDAREEAYRDYQDDLTNAWKGKTR